MTGILIYNSLSAVRERGGTVNHQITLTPMAINIGQDVTIPPPQQAEVTVVHGGISYIVIGSGDQAAETAVAIGRRLQQPQ